MKRVILFCCHRRLRSVLPCDIPTAVATLPSLLLEPRRFLRSSIDDAGAPLGNTLTKKASSITAAPPHSLAALHKEIANTWLAATSNKMLQPHHVSPNSKKLVWWSCSHCHHHFSRRVDLHVMADGVCPKCGLPPPAAMMTSYPGKSRRDGAEVPLAPPRTVVHTSRPKSTLLTLEASNINRVQKSVADGNYLREQERRILLPMLAKNYEKESNKIAENEVVFVSPKLDGIRCVVSYNEKSRRLLFFSRAGTMFECCDQFIEPALQGLFERDPKLVLDGELYNDSINQQHIRCLSARARKSVGWLQDRISLLDGRTKSKKKNGSCGLEEEAICFEVLTSAIRTTRARRSPKTEALQGKLQYHVFDVLYAQSLQPGHSPFSQRYQLLEKMFHEWMHSKSAVASSSSYSSPRKKKLCQKTDVDDLRRRVLRLVPVMAATVAEVPQLLQQAVVAGYEGVMVRRDSLRAARAKTDDTSQAISSQDGTGGYAYGQRSSTLLKYKLMQDDEFVIIDAVEGKGKWKGCLGAFLCVTKKQFTFSVAPAMPEEKKREIWIRSKGKEFIGKALTVQFQDWTPDGLPRFPVGKCIRGSSNKKDWI